MNGTIQSAADLRAANITQAWAFADGMTADEFEQLCRLTLEELRRDERGARECAA
jgi:hypothetical protein